jgi:hypothetical protein
MGTGGSSWPSMALSFPARNGKRRNGKRRNGRLGLHNAGRITVTLEAPLMSWVNGRADSSIGTASGLLGQLGRARQRPGGVGSHRGRAPGARCLGPWAGAARLRVRAGAGAHPSAAAGAASVQGGVRRARAAVAFCARVRESKGKKREGGRERRGKGDRLAAAAGNWEPGRARLKLGSGWMGP